MITPSRPFDRRTVARHYDELDPFYRALWGEHLHHGYWTTGSETPRQAAVALVDEVIRRAELEPGHSVCDVGCGYGAVTRHLSALGMIATGITISAVQHRHATAAGSGRFLLGDWQENHLADRSFDAVLAIECLSHMDDPGRAAAEAFRVLRPGGRFVACVWLAAPDARPWQVRRLLRPLCDEGRLSGLPTAADHRHWATAAGFTSIRVEDVSDRVRRTWAVCAGRVARDVLRPSAWRYLLDRRNTERAFALSVLRLLLGYRTGAVRYGILTARRPAVPEAADHGSDGVLRLRDRSRTRHPPVPERSREE